MAKKPLNQGKPWTNEDVSELDTLAQQNMPSRLIAMKMGRTLEAIYRKAKQRGAFRSNRPINCLMQQRRNETLSVQVEERRATLFCASMLNSQTAARPLPAPSSRSKRVGRTIPG
jgi:hypothetical protein